MSVLKTEHEKNLYALKREREMKLLHAWNKIYQTLEFYIFKSRLTSQDSILLYKSLLLGRTKRWPEGTEGVALKKIFLVINPLAASLTF